jgi:hypothetical protein
MAFRARFIPKNPHKYRGDVDKIFARSSWEASVMKFFDSSSAVLSWASEEIAIPYLKPEDARVHHYYPDFIVEFVDKEGNIKREIVEVKPLHESDAAYAKHERSKAALQTNEAKWKAAIDFAEKNGMTFRVITEKSIFHQVEKPKKTRNGNRKTSAVLSSES